ncbi:MAG TPA: phospholipid carrier-dependent glycosyltransferase, partial [Pseudomonadales bacterium]|nr:phospholipid carrier-dependent glycosyltransferase [Pseudomonadales bacterium]
MSASARAFIALVALYAIVWFVALGYRDLVDPDEGRYSEIPREMIASGDWVTPRLDGLKYFEKPPLQYWLTAVSFEAFGMSNATARLWLAFIGFAGALWTAYVAFRLYGPDAGWFAFVASSSAVLYSGASHYLTLDMSVSVFIVVGLGCLVLAQRERSRPKILRNWMLLGYAALAAAVMTKGLIGVVLPAAAVFLYSIWQRDWEIWRRLHLVKGTLLLLALTAPWFVLVSERNSEFL